VSGFDGVFFRMTCSQCGYSRHSETKTKNDAIREWNQSKKRIRRAELTCGNWGKETPTDG